MTPVVTILTYCIHPDLAYGTLLVFDTLRIGFPNARVEVYDNGSCAVVKPKIRAAANRVGASFHELSPKGYVDHYRWLLTEQTEFESLVICDPDVVFWNSVEHWRFDPALLAGRLIPDRSTDLFLCLARLHPSLLWIPSVQRLREQLLSLQLIGYNGFAQRTCYIGGRAVFWDTLAGLYQAFPSQCRAFCDFELDSYDHLFYGSHLPLASTICGSGFDAILDGHRAAAQGRTEALRGIWRKQQVYFEREQLLRDELPTAMMSLSKMCSLVQQWQEE
jgi:hypothetical protein